MKTKKILNYENYEVNEVGEVFNISKNTKLTGSIGENGYKYYRLSNQGKKKMFYAHRLVAEYFIPNLEQLPVVNHKDGNKLNNNVENLEWVSYSDNIKHAYKNNLNHSNSNKRERYEKDLENETWVKVPGFNYSISNFARIKNDKTLTLLKPTIVGGYYKVRLSNAGLVKDYQLHRLMFQAFYPEIVIEEDEVIDHIDGNKLNNSIDNLQKVKLSENVKAAYYKQKTNSNIRAVEQYSKNGEFIASFPSCAEAARQLGLDSSVISKVCRGVGYKSTGGFIFKYTN